MSCTPKCGITIKVVSYVDAKLSQVFCLEANRDDSCEQILGLLPLGSCQSQLNAVDTLNDILGLYIPGGPEV